MTHSGHPAMQTVVRSTSTQPYSGARPPRSLRLDVGGADHLAPLFGFGGNELSEVGGRTGKGYGTQIGEPRLHLRIGERGVDRLVQLGDDLNRRVLWRAD